MKTETPVDEQLKRLEEGLQRLLRFAGPQVSYDVECSAIDMMDAMKGFMAEHGLVYTPRDG